MIIKLGGPRGWQVKNRKGDTYETAGDPTATYDTNTGKLLGAKFNCVVKDGQLIDRDGVLYDNAADFLERWSR